MAGYTELHEHNALRERVRQLEENAKHDREELKNHADWHHSLAAKNKERDARLALHSGRINEAEVKLWKECNIRLEENLKASKRLDKHDAHLAELERLGANLHEGARARSTLLKAHLARLDMLLNPQITVNATGPTTADVHMGDFEPGESKIVDGAGNVYERADMNEYLRAQLAEALDRIANQSTTIENLRRDFNLACSGRGEEYTRAERAEYAFGVAREAIKRRDLVKAERELKAATDRAESNYKAYELAVADRDKACRELAAKRTECERLVNEHNAMSNARYNLALDKACLVRERDSIRKGLIEREAELHSMRAAVAQFEAWVRAGMVEHTGSAPFVYSCETILGKLKAFGVCPK